MQALFAQKRPKLVGVDISASAVKILELGKTSQGYKVESYAMEPLPEDALIEGQIKDLNTVAEALQRAAHKARITTKFAAVAVHGASVIHKMIQMNAALSEQDMALQIAMEADRYIPFPLEEVYLDFQVMGSNDINTELVNVLLVASRSEFVASRVEALLMAGLTAKVVDVEAYTIERAFGLISANEGFQKEDQKVAVVDMGKTRLSLSVFYNNNMIYTREQEFSGKQLTLEIQRRYGLSEAEALFAQKEGGLPDDYEQEILKPFKETVLQQLARSLQLFYASTEYHTVDSILLGGELCHVPGLSALIEKQLKVPLRVANPFARMSIAPHVSVPMLNADAPSLLVCCGLALRSFE